MTLKPKLLLIRPKITDDDFTSRFSHPASDLVNTASDLDWDVTELECDGTNRIDVENYIRTGDFDFIIHYDHGETDKLFGQNDNVKEPILDNANVDSLSSTVVSTVSCCSAIDLGKAAVEANTAKKAAYLGYNLPFGCEYLYWQYFQRAANEANIALLEGKTFRQARARGYGQYTLEINNLLALPNLTNPLKFVAAALLWLDRESLTLVGDGSARAKP
jgi:hypothetical protein